MKCWCGGGVGPSFVEGEGVKNICLDSKFHVWDADGRPKEIRRLYIAGPMSGYKENNYPAFNRAADRLKRVGYEICNPADFGSDGGHYVDLLREDLRAMLDCQGVAFLDLWWESAGARNEIMVAGLLKMPVRSVDEWFGIAPVYLGMSHPVPEIDGAITAPGGWCTPTSPEHTT